VKLVFRYIITRSVDCGIRFRCIISLIIVLVLWTVEFVFRCIITLLWTVLLVFRCIILVIIVLILWTVEFVFRCIITRSVDCGIRFSM
jgi:hypothetical protein